MSGNQVYVLASLDPYKRHKKMELGQKEMELEHEEMKWIGEFRLDIRKSFFALRLVSHWNILSHGSNPGAELKECLENSVIWFSFR